MSEPFLLFNETITDTKKIRNHVLDRNDLVLRQELYSPRNGGKKFNFD